MPSMANPLPAVLDRDLFLVKEHYGFLKAANNYDVLDPVSGEVLIECREDRLGIFTKIFRFSDYKTMTPFDVALREPGGPLLARVRRGVVLLRSKVRVENGDGALLGTFRQRLFSLGGAFTVLDDENKEVCALKGKWSGFDYRLVAGDVEFAHISKEWGGLAKEMFTTADTYAIRINAAVPKGSPVRLLVLAAAVCIDMVLKE